MTFNEEECVICQKGFSDQEPSTSVTRGVPNLLEWSKTRKDIALQNHLNAQLKKSPRGKVLVHSKCRGNYVDIKRKIQVKRSASSEPPPTPKRQKLRSSEPPFEWKKTVSSATRRSSLMTDILIVIKIRGQYKERRSR